MILYKTYTCPHRIETSHTETSDSRRETEEHGNELYSKKFPLLL